MYESHKIAFKSKKNKQTKWFYAFLFSAYAHTSAVSSIHSVKTCMCVADDIFCCASAFLSGKPIKQIHGSIILPTTIIMIIWYVWIAADGFMWCNLSKHQEYNIVFLTTLIALVHGKYHKSFQWEMPFVF